MDVCRVAGQQHAASAVGLGKPRVVRPPAPVFERLDADVRAADAAQDRLDLFTRDRSLPVFGRSDEVQHEQSTGDGPVREHATRGAMPANGQQAFGMIDLGGGLVERRCRRRAGEGQAGHLADEAAPAVATNEPGAAEPACACRR